ncbi:MAG: AmmeMemoRadiSam system protein B [Candidatus Heimdallarchaeaceae archaeon]|jgi:AmmeMemoRadiSam system protein B
MIRSAQYAGSFYERKPEKLTNSIEQCFLGSFGPKKLPSEIEKKDDIIPFFVVPHAGYIYSGPVAAWSYLELSKYPEPDTIIIFGPNHTGFGAEIGVPDEVKAWETPLGDVEINHELINKLVESSNHIRKSDSSHAREHSIEVQLPFLQYILEKPFKFIPISLLNQGIDAAILLGEIVARVCKDENIVTHFETHDVASKKDNEVLQAIEKMDIKGMYDIKYNLNVSMCGHGPIAATIETSKRMGRTKGEILSYATSGDVSGMKSQVVGYGAVAFYPE